MSINITLLKSKIRDSIPSEVLDIARQTINEQPQVPTSPGTITDARIDLCAAAAVAWAAAVHYRREDVKAYISNAVAHNDKYLLPDAFDRLGLPKQLCMDILLTNDAFPDFSRKTEVLSLILA